MGLAAVATILGLILVLTAVLVSTYNLRVEGRQQRRTMQAVLQRQGEIEAEHRATKAQLDKVQRENANAKVVLQGALVCAQRAEEKATALQAAVLAEDCPEEPPVH